MAEEMVEYGFDEVNVDETLTESEVNRASAEDVPGLFICTVTKRVMTDQTAGGYTSNALYVEFEVDEVLELEYPIKDDDGKNIERGGFIATRPVQLTETQKAAENAVHAGGIKSETIRMPHASEKNGTKNRRIRFADAMDIVTPGKPITGADWKSILGKQVIVRTTWNAWDVKGADKKLTGERKRNVRIDFMNGFKRYEGAVETGSAEADDADFDDM